MKRDKLTKSISVAVLLSIVMNNAQAFSLTKEKAVDPLQSKIDMLEQQVSDLSEKIHRFEVYFSKDSQAADLLQTLLSHMSSCGTSSAIVQPQVTSPASSGRSQQGRLACHLLIEVSTPRAEFDHQFLKS